MTTAALTGLPCLTRPRNLTRLTPLTPLTPLTTLADEAVREFMHAYRSTIQRYVYVFGRNDDALHEELWQAARIALWHIDASRFGDADAPLLLRKIAQRMQDTQRAWRRALKLGGLKLASRRDVEDAEADLFEPRHMRRAREERFDPQDPCTEHL